MKQSIINVAAIAALTLGSGNALADAYGSAQLSNFRISIYKLDIEPGDTGKPSVTFGSSAGSLADITGQESRWPASDPSPTVTTVTDSHAGTGEFGATSAHVGTALAGGSSSVSGSLASGFTLAAASHALGDPASVNSAYADADLGSASFSFLLSADSVLVITATADISGSITGVPGYEAGGGAVSVSLYGNDPSSQSSSVSFNAGVNSFGGSGLLHRNLTISFTNTTDTAIEGFFQASVSTSAFSQMDAAASVPEPSGAGLLLTGLGVLAALARHRRRR